MRGLKKIESLRSMNALSLKYWTVLMFCLSFNFEKWILYPNPNKSDINFSKAVNHFTSPMFSVQSVSAMCYFSNIITNQFWQLVTFVMLYCCCWFIWTAVLRATITLSVIRCVWYSLQVIYNFSAHTKMLYRGETRIFLDLYRIWF